MTEAAHHHHHTHTHHHHADPFEVTIRVPTPEALHELSIFLQEFEKKHRHQPHHTSFAQETAKEPERVNPVVRHDPLAGLGLGGISGSIAHAMGKMAEPAPAPKVTMEELRSLQIKLLEGGHLDASGIGRYCAELGIDAASPIKEHQYGDLYAKLVKHLPKH
jgi:hypothetical protein